MSCESNRRRGADDRVFRALASPHRRAVLALLRRGPRTTGQVAAALPYTRFAAMKHLAVLAEAGLLVSERKGRERWHRLRAGPLRRALRAWAR
jgi:DNA-binding transcriptional ArsR family regulator